MKAILLLFLIILALGFACVACLVLIGVYESQAALDFLVKFSAIIAVLAATSCVVALLSSRRDSSEN